jgi:transcriptional regulator of acetoin/glycerol metabolism
MAALMSYDYPGNVRELENAIEHAFVVCGGNVIEREDLPPHVLGQRLGPTSSVPAGGSEEEALGPLQSAEVIAIREALDRHRGNRTKAAEDLGVSRNTLWRKMKKYGIG